MLSLRDCIAMTDIPEDKLLELARREHLPVMLAVALAAQRGSELPATQRRQARRDAAGRRRSDFHGSRQPNRISPSPE
ncbi:MAG: hypothetical protein OEN20_11105 [Gammaproteobacteria bacterium]|nr:hypothetical protein [Gammaproteobacteria bacterium]